MPLAQMNVRIDEELKREGDAAFAKLGLTPSQAARSVWRLAASYADAPEKLAELISLGASAEDDERARRLASINEGSAIVDGFLAAYGLERPFASDEPDYDSLLEAAHLERLEDRGLL